jgi:hypothetical protein
MLSNHCSANRGSANKLTNLQEQSKPTNNQLNSIQSAPLNNSNNHDDILSDNSEIQSLNNTLSATMDEKQKMLLLKIANNSIAAVSAVASVADIEYGNVSAFLQSYKLSFRQPLFPFVFHPTNLFKCFISWSKIQLYFERVCLKKKLNQISSLCPLFNFVPEF